MAPFAFGPRQAQALSLIPAFATVILQLFATTSMVEGASVTYTSMLEYGDIKYLVSKNVVGTIDGTSIVYGSNSSWSSNLQIMAKGYNRLHAVYG